MDTSKWFGSSLTVWGVVVSFLSGAAPFLGSLFKVDLQPTDVTTVGDAGTEFIQAAMVLVGAIMAVIGRFSAKTALTVSKPTSPTQ